MITNGCMTFVQFAKMGAKKKKKWKIALKALISQFAGFLLQTILICVLTQQANE